MAGAGAAEIFLNVAQLRVGVAEHEGLEESVVVSIQADLAEASLTIGNYDEAYRLAEDSAMRAARFQW